MNPLADIITQLSKLPGIGEKSAQRLAFFFLSQPKASVQQFAEVLLSTRQRIQYCHTCFNIAYEPTCHLCKDEKREKDILCIVAEPSDIFAIEKTQAFHGQYHVLGGLLSPLDGIYPETLRLEELVNRVKTQCFQEIIMAINATVEGDSTVLYIKQLLAPFNKKLTTLAYGLPMGAHIDYTDHLTLQKAIQGRT